MMAAYKSLLLVLFIKLLGYAYWVMLIELAIYLYETARWMSFLVMITILTMSLLFLILNNVELVYTMSLPQTEGSSTLGMVPFLFSLEISSLRRLVALESSSNILEEKIDGQKFICKDLSVFNQVRVCNIRVNKTIPFQAMCNTFYKSETALIFVGCAYEIQYIRCLVIIFVQPCTLVHVISKLFGLFRITTFSRSI